LKFSLPYNGSLELLKKLERDPEIRSIDEYNGPQNLNQLLSDKASVKSWFKSTPKKEVHEKDLQWKI
jgi:hypothetical protein